MQVSPTPGARSTHDDPQPQRATGPEWSRCAGCTALVFHRRLTRNLLVCPDCGHHHRLEAAQRIRQLVDPSSFVPLERPCTSVDVLGFVDTVAYPTRIARATAATGLDDAALCGTARIGRHEVALVVMDFRFLGGSLGIALGEMVCRAAELALERAIPFVVVTASGGARMQEGTLALMQMASTSQAIACLQDAGLLTVSVITDPTFGGVAASFATNTDVVIAEAGARLGFAGPRVIRQTIGEDLPAGFQTAEFLLRHGQVDVVEERRNLRARLVTLLGSTGPRTTGARSTGAVVVREPAALARRDPWEVVGLARHSGRPTLRDHLDRIIDEFVELRGDRMSGDCAALVAGFGRIDGMPVAVLGHQKGHTTVELLASNFGMPRPEGYRKAMRVMRLAERLGLPVLTLVDTPGAHPGVEAEQRGQAQAIARNVLEMSGLRVPVVAVVTGEGGSGGALALSVADRVLITANGTYSVISPEGCSSILWSTPTSAPDASRALRLTAPDLLRLGVVDGVVPEPVGGAHADPPAASALLRRALLEELAPLLAVPGPDLVRLRRARFRRFGDVAAVADRAGYIDIA